MVRGTQTRERLVSTAAELFWRRGYAATGVSAIMQHAQATSGSFYHFFPTKDDLLLAVLEAVARELEDEVLGRAERETPDLAGRTGWLAAAYRERTIPDGSRAGLPVGALVAELGPELGEARRRVAELYERLVDRVESWSRESGTSAENARGLAELVVASLEGAALMALATGSGAAIDGCVERLRGAAIAATEAGGTAADEMPLHAVSEGEPADWKAW